MKYMVICKLINGDVIPACADTFSVAMHIADMFMDGKFTKCVEIVKIETGATTKFIF